MPGFMSLVFNLMRLWLVEKALQLFFDKRIANYTVLIMFFVANMAYYGIFEPAPSFQPAFFLISYLLFQFLTHQEKSVLPNRAIFGEY